MSYFKAFPYTNYQFSSTLTKAYKNISLRPVLSEELFGEASNLESYSIEDGETPETIAYDKYGDATFHWIVMLANNFFNIYTDWPMSEAVFDEYLKDKYRVQTDSDGVERTLTDTQVQEFLEFAGTPANNYNSDINLHDSDNSPKVVIRPKQFKDADNNVYSYDSLGVTVDAFGRSITRPTLTPVSYYDYENEINDLKRNIYLPYPAVARRINRELRDILYD